MYMQNRNQQRKEVTRFTKAPEVDSTSLSCTLTNNQSCAIEFEKRLYHFKMESSEHVCHLD